MSSKESSAVYPLAVLFAINTMNFFDRQILGAVGEIVRREWQLSDTALGNLGTAFTLLYAVVGLPLGWLSDRAARTRILAAGVTLWSLLTAASGMARNFWQLYVIRLGVGVGEASCAPAANSLIGDLFPASRRAVALGIFMLGLPIGIALSFLVSSYVTHAWGWRASFYVAGLPGILCGVAVLFMREPPRGRVELHAVGDKRREGYSFLTVLSIPTMWWVILSGALHNFNMYALGGFLSPFLIRYHGLDIRQAGLVSMATYGLCGVPGLILGGMAGDAIMKRRRDGRLLVAAVSLAVAAPFMYLSLGAARGEIFTFAVLIGIACATMYVYYATVYSTIHDVIEPSLRGTAMALYFFAMYVLGASLGPLGTGLASDYYTRHAAQAAGVTQTTAAALEPFRAAGLHSAMYLIPLLGLLLAVVLWAGSRTVVRDMDKLETWMRAESVPA